MTGPAAARPADGAVVVRPRRIAVYGAIAAAVVLGTMVVVGILLKNATDGEAFRTADQLGLISVGIFGAAAIMLVARPRVKADASGLIVRNVLGETHFRWEDVVRISFAPGAHWARVVLADDETHPMLAVQAIDRQYAVDSLTHLRRLHEAHRPPSAAPTPEAAEQERRRIRAETAAAAARPLGRLEVIDREKASAPRGRVRRR